MDMKMAALLVSTMALIASLVSPAAGAPQGPICFTNLPFTDVFALFFDSAGGTNFVGTGRNLTTLTAVTAYGFVVGSTATISFIAGIPATGNVHTFFGTAQLNVTTGQGSGRCEAANTNTGCGFGATFTLTMTPCPPQAIATEAEPAGADGPAPSGGGGG